MEAELVRLRNVIKQNEMDYASINGDKARLESQMLILLQENNELRSRSSISKSNFDYQHLKQQNQILREQIEILRQNSSRTFDQRLEQAINQINCLNEFIAQREHSYNQLIIQLQQLQKQVELKQTSEQILLINTDIDTKSAQIEQINQKLRITINQHQEQISSFNSQIFKLKQQIRLLKEQVSTKSTIQIEQFQKLKLKNQSLEEQLVTVRDLIETYNRSSIQSKQQQYKIKLTEASGDNIFESQIESVHQSDWRIKQYEWEKEKLKMQSEINKLKTQLYNASETTEMALKKQSEKYQKHISILNNNNASINLKLQQRNKEISELALENSVDLKDKIQDYQKKLKKSKNTIKQLEHYKQRYLELDVLNNSLNKQIVQLKQNLQNIQKVIEIKAFESLQTSNKTARFPESVNQSRQVRPTSTFCGSYPIFKNVIKQLPNPIQSQRLSSSNRYNSLQSSRNADYEKWLSLQHKIQKVRQQNNFLRSSSNNLIGLN